MFYLSTVILTVCLLPCLLRKEWTQAAGKFWGWFTACLLHIVGLHHEIRGDTQKKKQVIYAAKHQSAWETLVLYWELDAPVIVLKRELLYLPILGWFFLRSGCIAIDRKAGMAALKKLRQKAEASVAGGRSLLIFPQGTRVKLDEQPPFKKGVGRIYKALNLPCIPVALNTGKVWPKNSFMKFPGDIHISFLDPIMPGKENDEFTKELENKIYTEIKKYY